ncbi:MAG: protein kinase [Leptolyngbya sp. Prado105]|jgi:DNA-binding helix-hairpin-helix protein with protein kinase domain|nr:protein kinase [Leptolyngbya sp. Prado105]
MRQVFNLDPNQPIQTSTGLPCRVEEFLGSGGQGEVYRARLGDRAVALKWFHAYYIYQDKGLQKRLNGIVEVGAPNDQFLWPIAIATQGEGFGYLMQLREPDYRSLVDWVKRRVDLKFQTLTTTALELADSFLQLHTQGLCYRDISFSNVFFHPKTGRILIADNDNVAIDGSQQGGILGTPDFMAPEIVRREALPSQDTDLYSLAVLLFYLLHVHHPLYGKRVLEISCLDLPARMQICGNAPRFIFDPTDDSNSALPRSGIDPDGEAGANAIAFWSLYPQFLKALFIQAFTIGLHDPKERVRESIWRSAMARLRDSILHCPACGAENFYDVKLLKAGGTPGNCWRCQTALRIPARIRIASMIVMLNSDTVLYPHHTDPRRTYDFSTPVALVRSNAGEITLKNVSQQRWITTIDNRIEPIDPQRSITLQTGLKINFGNTEGEVRL